MLKNRCVNCDRVIEAPDHMRGHEMVCPHCEATNVLLSPEDAARQDLELDGERDAFLSGLSRASAGGSPFRRSKAFRNSAAFSPPVESLRGPGADLAVLATRRLKDVSVYLLAFAYLLLAIPVVLGFGVFMWGELPGVWGAVGFGVGIFVGVSVFIVFKYMSDTVRALADLTDLQRGIDARLADLQQIAETLPQQRDNSEAVSGLR